MTIVHLRRHSHAFKKKNSLWLILRRVQFVLANSKPFIFLAFHRKQESLTWA